MYLCMCSSAHATIFDKSDCELKSNECYWSSITTSFNRSWCTASPGASFSASEATSFTAAASSLATAASTTSHASASSDWSVKVTAFARRWTSHVWRWAHALSATLSCFSVLSGWAIGSLSPVLCALRLSCWCVSHRGQIALEVALEASWVSSSVVGIWTSSLLRVHWWPLAIFVSLWPARISTTVSSSSVIVGIWSILSMSVRIESWALRRHEKVRPVTSSLVII